MSDDTNTGVRAALEQGGGFWRSCTGCYETDEGYPTAPIDPVFGCERGAGCRECGGIGAVWDSTDYSDMADWIRREELKDEQIRAALRMADETFRDLGWHAKFEVTSAALKVLSLEAEPEPNPASFRAGVRAAADALGKTLGMTLHRQQQAILAILPAAPPSLGQACASDGCKNPAVVHFLQSDIGSDFCRDCYMKIHAMQQELLAKAATRAAHHWKDACRETNGPEICDEPCARCAAPALHPAPEVRAVSIPLSLLDAWYVDAGELLQECDDWLKLKRANHPSAAGLYFDVTERRRENGRRLWLDLAWLTDGCKLERAPERVAGIGRTDRGTMAPQPRDPLLRTAADQERG